ncbi:DUF2946 family protein [Albidovulum sp.]|uniref:DUF2946 family protein n=1 Tax=Albidovulum sp. TaxID=1872424 RepID=UPI003D7CDD21
MQQPGQIAGRGRSRKGVIPAAAGSIHRLCIAILVALSLMVSGVASAMPLSKAPGGTAFVICAETGSSTIYLDRSGNPVAPMKNCGTCPHCLLPTALLTPPSAEVPARCAIWESAQIRAAEATLPARPRLRPETRGPPPAACERLDMAFVGISVGVAAKDRHGIQRFRGRTQPAARA